jgi:hypothetical protein
VPTLTDEPHTQTTTPTLEWTNASDPDGDATHNEFQLSTDSAFSTIIESDFNAISPKTLSSTTTFTLYYWRVRTCDEFGSCSNYDNDSFFVYACSACAATETIVSGGTRKVEVNVTQKCTPAWNCGDWGFCSTNGVSIRTCFDANNCVDSFPREYQLCAAQPRIEEARPSADQEYFLGDFDLSEVYQAAVGALEEWMFVYEGEEHTFKVLEIREEGLLVEISSEPKQYVIPIEEAVDIDVDGDQINDITVKAVQKNHQKMTLVFSIIEGPELRIPASTRLFLQELKQEIGRGGYITYVLLLIIIGLSIALLYQYERYVVREKKVDKRLQEYVTAALGKGFPESQIKAKLLHTGFAEEEIDYIFDKIRKK